MAYYYNVLTLLATICTDETNEAQFTCTDDQGQEFSYEGNLIRVDNIRKMIVDICECYAHLERSVCFFGESRPASLTLEISINKLVNNL